MKNTYSPWDELASLPHIDLVWERLSDRKGEYRHWEQRIALDPRMRRHQARSVLCHELRHVAACDVVTHCGRTNLLQERRADRDAARLLVDVHDLGEVVAAHGEHHPTLARDLGVSLHIVRTRLANLHPSELHYLRGRQGAIGA
ncbi:ImmA/IrrE family metallo-endopeptidase [Pimelobacter simplex]|uniref:IrrE N-terminal-like domain-containing protein n=1 Tax=Nocardioides simplex TaxID=2045 RepID=A0A0A1DF31_NOCSI|nr:ImmA/IrrE family metallo-endopeptidase [Pimelobacter simplex]AIY15804.1 hypothetical protein KR76_01725 [Pimelobacter simplex]MCG8150353.1 ImmA/IrrE family metallo-endopeptidase [Pimelobacter simplex]GEB16720.1 hypothetical protein NSI01_50350 [Pimelobacter simplex]SFM89519.1 protein of unknown function [Pimelobacter simplex]